jgi:hypothetical protein
MNKGPVWNTTQTATLREQSIGAETLDSVITHIGKADRHRWIAILESGHKLLFSMKAIRQYSPIIGYRVYCKVAKCRSDNKYIGKYYWVGPRYWTIVSQEDYDVGIR